MMPEDRLKFIVKSVYDLLPTPQNKSMWFGEDGACRQCGETGTLTHILSGCRVALTEGKYKWRHDQVLREIAQIVEERRRSNNAAPRDKGGGKIDFIKPGEKRRKTQRPLTSYLDGAGDWSMQVDLDGKLRVPERVSLWRKGKQFAFLEHAFIFLPVVRNDISTQFFDSHNFSCPGFGD